MKETVTRQIQRWIIHMLCDALIWLHDCLIEYACARNLWCNGEERNIELPPEPD